MLLRDAITSQSIAAKAQLRKNMPLTTGLNTDSFNFPKYPKT